MYTCLQLLVGSSTKANSYTGILVSNDGCGHCENEIKKTILIKNEKKDFLTDIMKVFNRLQYVAIIDYCSYNSAQMQSHYIVIKS